LKRYKSKKAASFDAAFCIFWVFSRALLVSDLSARDSLTGLSLLLTINLKTPKPCLLPYGANSFVVADCMAICSVSRQSQVALRGYLLSDINLKPNKTLLFL
jgi:hypothetical protein